MKRLRIAVLSPYTDPVRGGITSYCRELARAYRDLDNDCSGFAAEGTTNELFRVEGRGKIGYCVRTFISLVRLQPDLIHSHSQHWYILLPSLASRLILRGSRLIFTFHTPMQRSRRRLVHDLMETSLLVCDGVVFVSGEMRKRMDLSEHVRQMVVLAAPEQEAISESKRVENTKKDRKITFAGPLVWPDKVAGLRILIEAFAGISARSMQWKLEIIGDGPLRTGLEQLAQELDIEARVQFKGFIGGLFDEMSRSEIYAQVSLQEGLPLSLLNAMVLGVAVIATTVGGMTEVIRHKETGYLVEPTRASVAAGLTELMNDDVLRNAIAERGKHWIMSELSWRKVASQCLAFAKEGWG